MNTPGIIQREHRASIMELKHLVSFLAVAERLSFIRAAEALNISQPALSAQIRTLEEEVGVPLLVRNRRSVRLTAAGQFFVPEARKVLAQADKAATVARRAALGEVGHLRVAFVSSAALTIVPVAVLEFRTQYAHVQLDLINLRTTTQLKVLRNRSMDVGFVRLPLTDSDLEIAAIHREPLVLVLPKNHRLANSKRVPIRELRDEPFVAYGRRWAPGFYDRITNICREEGFIPNVVQEAGEMHTVIAMVGAGVGIAILPLAPVKAQSSNIVIKQLPASVGPSEIGLVVRKGERSPVVSAFVALCSRICSEMNRKSSNLD
jgi:DNA-binding transcriptional LysR family regulator